MPNKTKQNTKNSTEQICSQPLYKSQTTHHTHPDTQTTNDPGRACRQPPQQVADAHTVLNVNPTVCSSAKNFLCPTHETHPHPPPTSGSEHMRAQENNHTPTTSGRADCSPQTGLPRKEVIQPHLPVRLPCYDFVPIANPTFDHSPRKNG